MIIDEVSESDQSESEDGSKSESSQTANLKIDNGNLPLSGGVTPRSKGGKSAMSKRQGMYSSTDKNESQDAKRQFADAIAQNQKVQRDKMIKSYKKIQQQELHKEIEAKRKQQDFIEKIINYECCK